MAVDPTGRVIVLIRSAAGVAAITPRVRGAEKLEGWAPPFVVVRRLSSVPWVGDPGTETADVGTFRYVALCYAARVENGEELAFRLAGAVHDAIHDTSAFGFPVSAGRAVIFRIGEDTTGTALRDPVTGEPYVPLNFSVLAGTQVLVPA